MRKDEILSALRTMEREIEIFKLTVMDDDIWHQCPLEYAKNDARKATVYFMGHVHHSIGKILGKKIPKIESPEFADVDEELLGPTEER